MKLTDIKLVKNLAGLADVSEKEHSSNPHRAIWLNGDMKNALDSITAVNEEKNLYTMDCNGYYYGKTVSFLMNKFGFYKAGCSAFICSNENDDIIVGRNYDFPHKDKDDNFSTLNAVVRCSPEGKYKSLAVADIYWLNKAGGHFYPGSLDDRKTDTSLCAVLPYLCMDGINEKGLTVSILVLDVKDGEQSVNQNQPGKDTIVHTILIRYLLDNCKNVNEAVQLAGSYNIKGVMNADFHLFVTDSYGNAVILEWRHNTMFSTITNAATNFYLSFDDGQDFYRNGRLTDKFIRVSKSVHQYHYGYGHGYQRFCDLVNELDHNWNGYKSTLSDRQAVNLLEKVSQPHTLHSVVYNSTKLSADIYLLKDYQKKYTFTLK